MPVKTPNTVTDQQSKADNATIAKQFEQLLVIERSSPEFLALWQEIDAYLSEAIAKERIIKP
jgi:hypothetical protein